MKTGRIHFVHLLNDRSGSPLVLSTTIKVALKEGYECHLYTNKASGGMLSDIAHLHYHILPYRWHQNRWITLFWFFVTQAYLFATLLRALKRSDVVYLNTLLPFGAGLASKTRGCKTIWHLHETSVQPEKLKRFLKFIVKHTASRIIYVSKYLQQTEWLDRPSHVIYNSLTRSFEIQAAFGTSRPERGTVLMLCSLKVYKGINDFLALSRRLPDIQFQLVINATAEEIAAHFGSEEIPGNLSVHPAAADVHPYYREARIVLNLSHPERWVETFGMTILEGFHYGIPAIVPPTGGICEVVEHGQNGYYISAHDHEMLVRTIKNLYDNTEHYDKLSISALRRAQAFSAATFDEKISEVLNECRVPRRNFSQNRNRRSLIRNFQS